MKLYRSKRFCFAVISVLIIGVVIAAAATRQEYWRGYITWQTPSVTDAEYLNVWDLRLLTDSSENDEIEEMAETLIGDAYSSNWVRSDTYKDVITEADFESLDAGHHYSVDDGGYESFVIKVIDSKTYGDKAIVFFTYKYECYDKDGNPAGGAGTEIGVEDNCPTRIYFEKTGGEWVVTKVNCPV